MIRDFSSHIIIQGSYIEISGKYISHAYGCVSLLFKQSMSIRKISYDISNLLKLFKKGKKLSKSIPKIHTKRDLMRKLIMNTRLFLSFYFTLASPIIIILSHGSRLTQHQSSILDSSHGKSLSRQELIEGYPLTLFCGEISQSEYYLYQPYLGLCNLVL